MSFSDPLISQIMSNTVYTSCRWYSKKRLCSSVLLGSCLLHPRRRQRLGFQLLVEGWMLVASGSWQWYPRYFFWFWMVASLVSCLRFNLYWCRWWYIFFVIFWAGGGGALVWPACVKMLMYPEIRDPARWTVDTSIPPQNLRKMNTTQSPFWKQFGPPRCSIFSRPFGWSHRVPGMATGFLTQGDHGYRAQMLSCE